MALNCGGRPPDDHNPTAGHLLTKKSSDINMPMQAMEASNSMASTTIFGAHDQSHHMKFAGGSSSSSYVLRSGTSHGDYVGTMSSYAFGGQTAESYYNALSETGSAGAAQLQLGRSDRKHCREEDTHLQQYQQGGAPAVQSTYRQVAVQAAPMQDGGTFDHHRHHQRLQSMPQQVQKEKTSSSVDVFHMQVHEASQGDLQEHRGTYYHKVGDHDNAGRTTRKVVEATGKVQDDEDGDEDEENERAVGVSSHGDLAGAASMSTSSGGGDSMSMSMMMMKKRRLTNEQVRSLEVSFERESKLEPERKNELAMELGLEPRQVAVWFQNRRARFKTKQLERDFDLLKLQYDAVRSEKEKLQAQVARLKDLLDAQMATSSKGNTPTTSSEKQAMDDGMSTLRSSPHHLQSMDGGVDAKHAEVFSTDNSDPTLVHVLEAAKSFNKAPCMSTVEVKPSLQVPHINHHRQNVYKQQQQQQNFASTTFHSPPTKLSLCSPQQLFLHQMVSMRMEGDDLNHPHHNQPAHNLYNQEHYNLPRLNETEEEEYRTDSMICFDSAWHHDP